MRALVLLVLLLVPSVSACSDGGAASPATAADAAQQEDGGTAAWRAAVAEELGTDTFDLAALQAAAGIDCRRTDAGAWTVQLALSGDTATSTVTRIGLEHACPEVVPAFDAGVAAVEAAPDPLALVCAPGVEVPAEAEMQADLVCGSR